MRLGGAGREDKGGYGRVLVEGEGGRERGPWHDGR
jgi:hypothetical protein